MIEVAGFCVMYATLSSSALLQHPINKSVSTTDHSGNLTYVTVPSVREIL
jgi:hypothetical protein